MFGTLKFDEVVLLFSPISRQRVGGHKKEILWEAGMPAWVEDAQQLTELRDLSNSQSSVLLRTTEVEEFLSNLNLSSHALVAPKGFGKTSRVEVETYFATGG